MSTSLDLGIGIYSWDAGNYTIDLCYGSPAS
jgi:hypothetical protein